MGLTRRFSRSMHSLIDDMNKRHQLSYCHSDFATLHLGRPKVAWNKDGHNRLIFKQEILHKTSWHVHSNGPLKQQNRVGGEEAFDYKTLIRDKSNHCLTCDSTCWFGFVCHRYDLVWLHGGTSRQYPRGVFLKSLSSLLLLRCKFHLGYLVCYGILPV